MAQKLFSAFVVVVLSVIGWSGLQAAQIDKRMSERRLPPNVHQAYFPDGKDTRAIVEPRKAEALYPWAGSLLWAKKGEGDHYRDSIRFQGNVIAVHPRVILIPHHLVLRKRDGATNWNIETQQFDNSDFYVSLVGCPGPQNRIRVDRIFENGGWFLDPERNTDLDFAVLILETDTCLAEAEVAPHEDLFQFTDKFRASLRYTVVSVTSQVSLDRPLQKRRLTFQGKDAFHVTRNTGPFVMHDRGPNGAFMFAVRVGLDRRSSGSALVAKIDDEDRVVGMVVESVPVDKRLLGSYAKPGDDLSGKYGVFLPFSAPLLTQITEAIAEVTAQRRGAE